MGTAAAFGVNCQRPLAALFGLAVLLRAMTTYAAAIGAIAGTMDRVER
jgi:hypothetical protein